MFAAYVFTIIDSQDMQERHRLGPIAVTPGGAQCKGRGLKIAHRFPCLSSVGHRGRPAPHIAMAAATSGATAKRCLWPGDVVAKQICIPRAGIVFGLGHSRRDGMMRGDEQVKLPPLPRDGFAPSGHALPDLRPHRRAPARQSQRSPDRALPAGTPGSARPPFRIAGLGDPHTVRGLPGGDLPGGPVQCQGGGRGPR